MFSIRPMALLALGALLMLPKGVWAQDKVYRGTSSNPIFGKITKVDDNQIYFQLGSAGGTAFKRAEIKKVEISMPPTYDEGKKALVDGKMEKVVSCFEPIHNQYYGLPEAWLEELSIDLGQAYLSTKQWAKARDVFVKFQKFYSASESKGVALAGEAKSAYESGDRARAIAILEGQVKESDKRPFVTPEESVGLGKACVILGHCYLDSNKKELALETFLKVPVLYYQDSQSVAEAEYHIALIYEKLNNMPRAKGQLEELMSEFPESPFAAEAKKKIGSLKS